MSTTIYAPPVEETPVEETPLPGTVGYEAARLDRLFPGWHNKVNTDTLNMSSADNCVLGQISSGEWSDMFAIVDRDGYQGDGFYSSDLHRNGWIEEINKRRR